jgi:hypothetical protein
MQLESKNSVARYDHASSASTSITAVRKINVIPVDQENESLSSSYKQ